MKRNKIPKRILKQMNASNTCKCDICGVKDILVSHHILGRDIPNPNHSSNIANICGSCHNQVHREIVIIERWVKTTNGLELLWHKNDQPSFSGQDSKPYIIP